MTSLERKGMWENKRDRPFNKVIYLSMVKGSPSHEAKLAGIRRYCSLRGWEVVPVLREEVSPKNFDAFLTQYRPIGCVVDGVGRFATFQPHLFRGIPVSYIGYLPGETGRKPNFRFDAEAIAKAALRELSAGRPPCYAAVGFMNPFDWSRHRIRAFRAAVTATGMKCHVFPNTSSQENDPWEAFVNRLTLWLNSLPEHCAVFAVSDQVAVRVTEAAKRAMRHIPRSLTLLSVDNFSELCENAATPISSIQLDLEREGYIAAMALDEQMNASMGKIRRTDILYPLMVVRRKSTSGHGRHEKWILDAVEIIRREACDGLTARALIARFPASKTNFNRRFREAIGHSVLDEILNVRLEKACTLLSQTDTAIGAIPGLCGFGCNRTLDALFRSRFKMSMLHWRRSNTRRFNRICDGG